MLWDSMTIFYMLRRIGNSFGISRSSPLPSIRTVCLHFILLSKVSLHLKTHTSSDQGEVKWLALWAKFRIKYNSLISPAANITDNHC